MFLKCPSQIHITMDPESSKDGIFWPNISMEMDGHSGLLCLIHAACFRGHSIVTQCPQHVFKPGHRW